MSRFWKQGMALAALAAAVGLWCWSPSLARPPKPPGGGGTTMPYTLVDLGGFTGGDLVQAWAYDVNNPDPNDRMTVVGFSFAPIPGVREAHAALWDVTSGGQIQALTDIAPPGYRESRAQRVNDRGVVLVGGYVWSANFGFRTLPGFTGAAGLPVGLNDAGDIVGSARHSDGKDHGALWRIDLQGQITGPVDLGGFFPQDINNKGLMAGSAYTGAAIAWFDQAGNLQVQTLGALDSQGYTQAVAVNDNGMVTGNSIDRFGYWEAFVWTADAGMIGLGKLGSPDSVAADINNKGQIVGWSNSGGRHSQVGFVWQDGQMRDLNAITDGAGGSNWIQMASGINDKGHIVGLLHKTKPISEDHALLLVPNGP